MAADADVVSCATVSVCGVPAGTPMAAAVRFSVTPWIAVVTVSLELVPAVPSMVNIASLADSVCVHGLVADTDVMLDGSAALAPAVDVMPRLDRPASAVTVPTET